MTPALPTQGFRTAADRAFFLLTRVGALVVVLAAGGLLLELVRLATTGDQSLSWGALFSRGWDPARGRYGAQSLVYGTLATSAMAIVVAAPVGVGLAVFVRELVPRRIGHALARLVALLAAVPSVVYGAWALSVVSPALRSSTLVRGSAGDPGSTIVVAAVVLAVMSIPTVAQVTSAVFSTVPLPLRRAALALGATRGTLLREVVLPHVRAGVIGAVLLGFARAAAESVAVAMVIGNQPRAVESLFEPGASVGSVLALHALDAIGAMHRVSIARLALILAALTVAVELVARALVRRASTATTLQSAKVTRHIPETRT